MPFSTELSALQNTNALLRAAAHRMLYDAVRSSHDGYQYLTTGRHIKTTPQLDGSFVTVFENGVHITAIIPDCAITMPPVLSNRHISRIISESSDIYKYPAYCALNHSSVKIITNKINSKIKKPCLLSLGSNNIDNEGAKYLAFNKYISVLNIADNYINDHGAKYFLSNKNIIHLRINDNNISPTLLREIDRQITRNFNRKYLKTLILLLTGNLYTIEANPPWAITLGIADRYDADVLQYSLRIFAAKHPISSLQNIPSIILGTILFYSLPRDYTSHTALNNKTILNCLHNGVKHSTTFIQHTLNNLYNQKAFKLARQSSALLFRFNNFNPPSQQPPSPVKSVAFRIRRT